MDADFSGTVEDIFILSSSTVLTAFGIIGNTLVLYILSQKEMRKVSIFRYLIAASVFDIMNCLTLWPYNYPNFFLMNTYSLSCKLQFYIANTFFAAGPWFILLSSLDRLIIVYYPYSLKFRKMFKFQALEMGTLLTVLMIINLPFYFYTDIIDADNDTYCGYVEETEFMSFYLDLYAAFLDVLIPFLLMILSTGLICYRLMFKKTALPRNERKYKKDKQLVKVLITIDAFFLTCNLPYYIFVVTVDALSINYFGTFLYDALDALTVVYNAFDFFVFFFSNTLFRDHVYSLFYRKSKNAAIKRSNPG